MLHKFRLYLRTQDWTAFVDCFADAVHAKGPAVAAPATQVGSRQYFTRVGIVSV